MFRASTLFRFAVDKTGSIAPLTALMLPLLMGMAGVGVDVSFWMHNQRNMQAAADAAALAAAYELGNDFSEQDAIAAGLKEAINNGYQNVDGNSLSISFSEDGSNTIAAVQLTSKENKYFSQVLYKGDIYATVTASSAVIMPQGGYCLLSLDETADGAITAVGAVDIDSASCGIAVNSNSDSALDLSGNVDIDISMGELSIVGDMDVSGSVDLETGTTVTGANPKSDPYEDLEVPDSFDPDDCDYNNTNVNGDGVLNPGTYCGGIRIGGNGDVVFNPGVYYLVDGDLRIVGNGSITAEGVTIILTSSDGGASTGNLDISGGKDMLFTAPEDGDLSGDEAQFEGVAFYQDRNAPDDGSCNSLTGNSALDLIGSAYFPTRCLDIGGNAADNNSQASTCSRVIALTIRLHGNPNMGNDCDGVDLPENGDFIVRLIL